MKVFSKKQLYFFSLLTGILLWASWPEHGLPFLLLIAFCPLLIVEEHFYREKQYKAFALFRYAYVATLSFNVLTTWWIYNATIVGAIAAIICNALFMALVLVLFHYIRMRTGNRTGYAALVILWISFEYVHLNWQLSWPWLTLGNGFANYATCVQWYQYTGILGGTLWILCSNVVIFHLIKYTWLAPWKEGNIKPYKWGALAIVLLPLLISWAIYFSYTEKKNPVNIVVVQPNIDPYNEKFSGDFKKQLTDMLQLADTKADSATDYLVFPETALTEDIWENNWTANFSIPFLKKYLQKYPRMSIVTGASTYRGYDKGDSIPETARAYTDGGGFYDAYNTAIQLNNSFHLQVYHKCKLVPGVETMPFHKLLAPLAKMAFDLGGTSGTLGTQKEPSVFYSPQTHIDVAPVICYESIYGEYLGEYIKKGAQLIFIITNDGWWKDTPGYRQHLCYARLRAVEMRRCIARSANTGISAFINEKGDITQQTKWWQPAAIKATLDANSQVTFYAHYGDYIGRDACILSGLLFLLLLVSLFIKRKSIA